MIGEVPYHLTSNDAIAWEGVVVDPDGRVEQAIARRASLDNASILEVGGSALTYAVRHAERASKVYVAELDGTMGFRGQIPFGFPANVSLVQMDEGGLPLRSDILDLAILREPFLTKKERSIGRVVPEAMRLLKPGGQCLIVTLNLYEGDLGSLLEKMLAENSGAKDNKWIEQGFDLEQIETQWRAPGRTILRRVLAAEFGSDVAEQVAVSELGCLFDIFWKQK